MTPEPTIPQPGDYKELEKLAAELAGGVGKYARQPWTPANQPKIDYGAQKRQPSKCWQPTIFDLGMVNYQRLCFPDTAPQKRAPKEMKAILADQPKSRKTTAEVCRVDKGWADDQTPAAYQPQGGFVYDDDSGSHLASKLRKPLYAGKRATDDGVQLPPRGTWIIDSGGVAGYSQAQQVCSICGAELPIGQRKYCPGDCQRRGKNAEQRLRRLTGRVWPVDERQRYTNIPEPTFDLTTITVAGWGRLDIEPRHWNRHNPRSNPQRVNPRPGTRRDRFMLPLHKRIKRHRGGPPAGLHIWGPIEDEPLPQRLPVRGVWRCSTPLTKEECYVRRLTQRKEASAC